MDIPNFDIKSRVPVRALSYENKDMAVPKELVIDYDAGIIYVTDKDGNVINVSTNQKTIDAIINYISQNPDTSFLPTSGGKMTGHLYLEKGAEIRIFGDHGVPYGVLRMGDDGYMHIGNTEEAKPICIDGPIILGSNNYGTTPPENPEEGQFFVLIPPKEG